MIKRLLPILFSIIIGSVAVVLTQRYIAKQKSTMQAALEQEVTKLREQYQVMSPNMVEVIVAKEGISEDVTLTAGMLERRQVPEDYVQPFAITRAVDIIGLVAKAPIAAGEQILRNKLKSSGEVAVATSLSEITPEGMRAITIGTDALTGVGGFVRPGDNVDVLWTVAFPSETGDDESVTLALFQNVKVLAVGDQLIGQDGGKAGGIRDYTVTLALTPQEASLMLYARREGLVQLSLRSPNEGESMAALEPVNQRSVMENVLGRRGLRKPVRRNIEVIRGVQRSIVAISNE